VRALLRDDRGMSKDFRKQVAFTRPRLRGVNEILVTSDKGNLTTAALARDGDLEHEALHDCEVRRACAVRGSVGSFEQIVR
jgi:hypothetical protein